ncbi:MAG: hypothetical protein M1832_001229 [Thelocarpon impressellum]|nr:MAG: hypothetical protein M1832_001229 [Thelocarpon impressellum]
MKILETQSAHLTNHEVLLHLESMRARYAELAQQRGRPASLKSGNLETVLKELTDYLHTQPSPLTPPSAYGPNTCRELFVALQPFDLTKAELLMILNLRPLSLGVLDTIIEEMDSRFDDEQQLKIQSLIAEVLGADGGPDPAGDGDEVNQSGAEAEDVDGPP